MKKRTLTVVCLFLFFSLSLTSCSQQEVVKEIKNEETSAIPSLEDTLENSETEEVVEDSLNTSEQLETETEVEEVKPEDLQEISYAFGHLLIQQLKRVNVQFDIAYIVQGMEAGLAGQPAPLTEEEYEEKMNKIHEISFRRAAANNLVEAEEFLENNKHNENVIVLSENKLQYKIIQNGDGEEVSLDSTPRIYFKGTLLNGEVFGSSDKFPEPVTLALCRTIPGVSQGMLGMKVGEKRILYIHPELGYGDADGIPIPPNSLLIFEVEVVSILDQENQVSTNIDREVENSESLKEEVS